MGQKGGGFEREVCTLLSEWWCPGREDIFWRSSQSGGRATVRKRKGKDTAGHCGDVAATDPIGFPFTQTFTLELKRGYPLANPMHLLARSERAKPGVPLFEQFLDQAEGAAKNAGTPFWMIIHKWDYRTTMAYLPSAACHEIAGYDFYRQSATFNVHTSKQVAVSFRGTTLMQLLAALDPYDVIRFHKRYYYEHSRGS